MLFTLSCAIYPVTSSAQETLETNKAQSPEALIALAIESLRQACDSHGKGQACALLSQAYYDGLGIQKNLPNSLQYSSKGCDKVEEPSGVSCYLAAQDYESEIFLELDYEKANSLYEKGCELNNSDACYELANNYYYGYGVEESTRKATKYYQKACDLGDKAACDEF